MSNQQLIEKVQNIQGSVTFGMDGMIDEVMELVAMRNGKDDLTKVTRLAEFGNMIVERGTGGLAKERVLKRRSGGGFVYNTGRATAALGAKTTFLGAFGTPTVLDVFQDITQMGEVISYDMPANINVLEFVDGKIMMPYLDVLIQFEWAHLVKKLGEEKIKEILNKDIVGVGYWSNLYDFENIMCQMVLACVANGKTKRIFHDFANINKRSKKALLEALTLLGSLNTAMPQTLSLNEHEGGILADYLEIPYPKNIDSVSSCSAVLDAAKAMQAKTGLDEIVIHTAYYAVIATAKRGSAFALQSHCEHAVKTTGAGDTFNGGYVMACMGNLTPEERLSVANAATYCYVATGNPTTREGLLQKLAE